MSGHSQTEVAPDLLPALQALADPSRLKIVHMLHEREQCVCHLTEALDLKQSTISHHLSVLKKAGLVVDRRDKKDARWSYYSLSPKAVVLGQRIAALLDAGSVDPTPADCSGR
ncbi:MAG TPA: metalloregulator ArsR/SmtB family transcription factor [Chloroflexota bacterium]|nr:metalloregulator ArsR/SmtB family transcription factor [Chloroflexota bacterium]